MRISTVRAKNRAKTKTYRTYFPREWDAALAKMERPQPLLSLCAAHWKADHVLGNALLSKAPRSSKDHSSDDDDIDSSSNVDDRGNLPNKPESHARGKRPPSHSTSSLGKKVKMSQVEWERRTLLFPLIMKQSSGRTALRILYVPFGMAGLGGIRELDECNEL
jgi:hypothetical protein